MAEIGPHMLHDAVSYAEWLGSASSSSISSATTLDALRAENGPYRIVTPTEAAALRDRFFVLALQPFCGGCPPELAWETLNLIESNVL